jgi:putative hydrolase of the HAD superfamily
LQAPGRPLRCEGALVDSLGTLLRLEPPWPLLCAALSSRHGIAVDEEQAKAAMRAEIAYYLEHHTEGRDRESLAGLRARCAEVMAAALPPPVAALGRETLVELLLDSLRFVPYPDAAPALARLRTLGLRVAVVSNWDCSLGGLLGGVGLGGLVDAVITSAEVGARKPEPAIFEAALAAIQCPPERAMVVGDTLATDVEGGRAAGIRPVLLDRNPEAADTGEVERIFTLENLPELMSGSPIV